MTKRDFFRILIKVFGLYSLILAVFIYFPNSIKYVVFEFEPVVIILLTGSLFVTVLIYILLIRKTDYIINLLKIHEGFDDDKIDLANFNSTKIMKLALIIIAAFLIIDYLPEFLQFSYLAFKEQVSSNAYNQMQELHFEQPVDYFYWGISAINIVLGIVIFTNYDKISVWLTRNDKHVG